MVIFRIVNFQGTQNRDGLARGIVGAVSLVVVVVFIAIMLVFLNQNVQSATRYAEKETSLYASEAESIITPYVDESGELDVPDSAADAIFADTALENACCFRGDGTVLFSADPSVPEGSNVFDAYPALEDVRIQIAAEPSQRWSVWSGLDMLLPQGQMFYEVRYCKPFKGFLLAVNDGNEAFEQMRTSSTTIILALATVMGVMLLLIVSGVRWYRARIVKITATDELTGLANRKSFAPSYERFVTRENAGPCALALVDVDFFKKINDTYGHAAGDRALVAVAREVEQTCANNGLSGRWGGDEFICVIETGETEARERIQRMIDRIKAIQIEEGVNVSISVGMTSVDPTQPLERMVELADDALYMTKGGGRGFLTVFDPETTPRHSSQYDGKTQAASTPRVETTVVLQEERAEDVEKPSKATGSLWASVVKGLMDGVRKMVPFVAGGGVLIALGFLIDAASIDMNTLSGDMRSSFGSITPIAAGLHDVGTAAFNFMLPIFAAFFARSLAGNHAFMAGFAGGYLASINGSGFAGAICAGLASAAVVKLMSNYLDDAIPIVKNIAPVLLYPVFSLLIMYLLSTFAIVPITTAFESALTSVLEALLPGNRVILGAASAAMMATDMGGPINKAAYHFGTAAISAGSPDIMAAVMVGGMVPPCGIAVAMALFRNKFRQSELSQLAPTLVMGLSFITEGAIPFVLTDPVRVIVASMAGSALAGGLSMAFGCTLMAPHGGLFVFPVVGEPLLYLVSLIAGSLLSGLILGALKRPVAHDDANALQ